MSTAKHTAVEPDEEPKSAPERYRAEIRHRRGWAWEARLVTHHVLPVVGERGELIEATELDTESEPYTVRGERWARWKGRRLVAAALKRDVREGQPWAVVQ